MTYAIIRLLHLGAILVLAGAVIIENIAIKPLINTEDAHNLATVDRVAGLGAALTFGLGMVLWLVVGKPAAFYSSNPLFHAKLAVFILLIAVASYPAVFFNRHRATTEIEIAVPKIILVLLKFELLLLLALPIMAYLMARGVGLN